MIVEIKFHLEWCIGPPFERMLVIAMMVPVALVRFILLMPVLIFRRLIMSILSIFYCPAIIKEEGYKFSSSGTYYCPPQVGYRCS